MGKTHSESTGSGRLGKIHLCTLRTSDLILVKNLSPSLKLILSISSTFLLLSEHVSTVQTIIISLHRLLSWKTTN